MYVSLAIVLSVLVVALYVGVTHVFGQHASLVWGALGICGVFAIFKHWLNA